MLQLNNDDFVGFSIQTPGIVVVYFKQSGCNGCNLFDPIFLQIERKKNQHQLNSVQFATVNVSNNPQILRKAKEANVDIDKTPLLLIFFQSTPYAKYHGPLDEDGIFMFIKQVLANEIRSIPPSVPQSAVSTYQDAHQNDVRLRGDSSRIAHTFSHGTAYKQPSETFVKSRIVGRKGNNAKEQMYTEDLGEGLFDNWKFLTPKNKPWLPDVNQAF